MAAAAADVDVASIGPPDFIDVSTLPLLLGPFNATRLSLKFDVLFDDAVAPVAAAVELFEMVSVLLAQLISDECYRAQSIKLNEHVSGETNTHAHIKIIK